jgi:hypothetical protein
VLLDSNGPSKLFQPCNLITVQQHKADTKHTWYGNITLFIVHTTSVLDLHITKRIATREKFRCSTEPFMPKSLPALAPANLTLPGVLNNELIDSPVLITISTQSK